MTSNLMRSLMILLLASNLLLIGTSCKHRKKINKTEDVAANNIEDTLNGRCKLDFKSAKTLSKHLHENEFDFTWINAKANVTSIIDSTEENFDIRVNMKKDSAMLITIQYLLGLQVAKVLITRDTVKFVNYIQKTYFKGDFVYISELLNADIDYDLLQAVLFGNSAEFQDDETKLKPTADRTNCHYLLSTERKRRLRKIQSGSSEAKDALQTLTLNPDNYKILTNEFIDPTTNRRFIANYSNFTQKDSVYAPYHVDIAIVAEKKATIKIDYVRIEKNTPQKLSLSIPHKYDPIKIQKK
ncbi:MAG: DUF4292 domain-containing protein [bacterium]|nr:DUF4292 domain-containing protein [bacterium]